MNKKWLTLFFVLTSAITKAQLLYDNNWVFGDLQNKIIDFKNDTIKVLGVDSSIFFFLSSATISDPNNGQLRIYTNGRALFNRYSQIIENGDSISPGFYSSVPLWQGYPNIQSDIILPQTESNKYLLIHTDIDEQLLGLDYSYYLRKTEIDFTENDSGIVLNKNEVFFTDTMTTCCMAVNKSSNGFGWWLTKTEFNRNNYFSWKIQNDSIYNPVISTWGIPYKIPDGLGGFSFSPNGNWFAGVTYDSVTLNRYVLNIAKFDRCTGHFFDGFSVFFPVKNDWRGNCIFSPDSRFVYVSTTKYIYQFDLTSNNIQTSIDTVGIMLQDSGDVFDQELNVGQLTPTGKIYFAEYGCTHPYIHVIESPNEKGIACNFHQKAIIVPSDCAIGIPYFPNYNLKALGNFRADAGEDKTIAQGDAIQLGIQQIEGVKYEWSPKEWLSNTNSPNPIANPCKTTTYYCTFTDTTTFSSCNVRTDTVVVTVTGDASCKDLPVQTLLTQNENFNIYNLSNEVHLSLYNSLGQLIFIRDDYQNDFSIRNLSPGMYFYVIEINGLQNKGRFVVVR